MVKQPARIKSFKKNVKSAAHFLLFAGLLAINLAFIMPAFATNTFPGETITGSGSISRSNVGADSEIGEPTPNNNASFQPLNSMWYSWTAPGAGTLVVQTCSAAGTSFDTVLGAYTDTTSTPAVNSLTQIAANDDTAGCAITTNAGYGSRVTLAVSSGTIYRIQADGYSNLTGTFLLQYAFTPAAINVVVTDNSTTEGADTAAFTVNLATQPSANTTVTINPDPTGQCTYSPTSLTFTTANYATTQTVTATAVNDTIAEAATTCAPASIIGSASNYSTVTGTPPSIIVLDNDQGVLATNTLNTATEGGATGNFSLKLSTLPTANVTVTIASDATGQCTFAPTSLIFTTANWNVAQTVTTTALNDLVVEGTHGCTTGAIIGNGGGYVNVAGTAPSFIITDNDTGTIVIATTIGTATEGGATGAFTAKLGLQPSGTVTVTIAADATGQCTFAPTSLTFTTANWNVAQTITTTAFNDLVVEGTHSCSTGAITASGGSYTGVTGTAPSFIITDNDIASITVLKSANVSSVSFAGDVINYSIQITNSGNVAATTLTVTDSLTSVICPSSGNNTIASIAVGTSVTCTATYTATQANFDTNGGGDGDIDNMASVTGIAGGVAVNGSNSQAVLCTQNSNLTLVKYTDAASAAGSLVKGQVVTYYFNVKNVGNVTLSAINVIDIAFNGNGTPLGTPMSETLVGDVAPLLDSTDPSGSNGVWDTIKPGDTVRFQINYTVTQTDIDLIQ